MNRSAGVDLEELLCFDLYAASRAMTRRYRPLLERHGLTYPQYLVVVVLGGRGPLSIKELASLLHLDHGTLTPILRRLEGSDVIRRGPAPGDGRSWVLELTAAGQAIFEDSDRVQCRLLEVLGLSADEVRELQLQLRRVASSLDAEQAGGLTAPV
ncbi:MarR family winged helix-turn-helix transcriptional regulator [Serinicoccus kebangsaanensis]|uniref:MarR family winged helix-turn-helix transcriptional regulator n=1 Tax=Serinicoccus kebangsaanensis TaxID=2602069 RepID=UPI00178C53BA|nr:MarR family transcriptional regulator [Serinicoccus kebangsaanensis]